MSSITSSTVCGYGGHRGVYKISENAVTQGFPVVAACADISVRADHQFKAHTYTRVSREIINA